MSMTVQIQLKGMTDLGLFQSAVGSVGGKLSPAPPKEMVRGRPVVAVATIGSNRLGILRTPNGELALVGDEDWLEMRDPNLKARLRQHYTVAAVRRRAEALNYHIAEVEQMENGSIRVVARGWRQVI